MKYPVSSEILDFLWSTLNQEVTHPKIFRAEHYFKKLAGKGWVYQSDADDILTMLDSRLSTYKFDIIEFTKMMGINWESVCHRPNARSNNVVCYDAIRIEDLVLLMILLERFGFQVDAGIFVDILLPKIKSRDKKYFFNAELEIFWYAKTRQKFDDIYFILKPIGDDYDKQELIATQSGYKITLIKDSSEEQVGLKVSSPKYRRLKSPKLTICKDCGLEWYKGDPDSSANHREQHKKIMYYLNPQPSTNFLNEREMNSEVELVRENSPHWKHYEMYIRARAFKREFGYDFIQWGSEREDNDPNVHGFLFANDVGEIVGACSFRLRTGTNSIEKWWLDWVWVCPKERRKKHLEKRWQMFKKKFGDFGIESPISEAMKMFLKKQNENID